MTFESGIKIFQIPIATKKIDETINYSGNNILEKKKQLNLLGGKILF